MNRKNREPSRHWRKRHTRQGRAQKVTAASQDGKILEKFIQKGEKKVTKNKERKKMMTNFGWICWKQFFYFLTRRVVAVDCVFSFFLFPSLHFFIFWFCTSVLERKLLSAVSACWIRAGLIHYFSRSYHFLQVPSPLYSKFQSWTSPPVM